MIGRFRKKPVVVEAMRYIGNAKEIMDWTGPHGVVFDHLGLAIYTLEGLMEVSHGDWVIKGMMGEFYPCKPDIFEKTYDPA